jgi:NAD(P)-dependent dehydrogenase (short-subunit alcohol dehydrogenase family)
MTKTYVVTAANRGLGLELARQLAGRGDRVIGTARAPESATELAALDVQVEALDVAREDSIGRFGEAMAGEDIDVLINNAGIGVNSKPLEDLEFAEMRQFFEINTIGPLSVARALLPGLRRGGDKKIINMTSRMGSIGDNTSGAAYSYRASKAALNMVTRSLANDLRSDGFVCLVLHPGWVQTRMGGGSAPVRPEDSVSGMLRVIDKASADANGGFYDFTGARVPW